jgi:cytochrome P450
MEDLNVRLPALVNTAITRHRAGIPSSRPTLFTELLEAPLPSQEKTPARLRAEAQSTLSAGAETTSWSLAVGTFYLLHRPELLGALAADLGPVVRDATRLPPWRELEDLPYLTGVIRESVRLAYGISARTLRVAPTEDLVYPVAAKRGMEKPRWVIPKGYAVGMSSRILHVNPELFPEPESFKPERWIDGKGRRNKELEGLFQPFGRGTRRCLGIK